jgi:hypothetical protein
MRPGDVLGYFEMCQLEGTSLQRGMNYRLNPNYSVILMSRRPNAPYADRVEEDGKVLIYEGHDVPKSAEAPIPKILDQPSTTPVGTPTQNALFSLAAQQAKDGKDKPEPVKVYEKVEKGIWTYNGVFDLVDAWMEKSGDRMVYKFRLNLSDKQFDSADRRTERMDLEHTRLIPSHVKLEVWRRDKGRCQMCQSRDNLHYDHDLPFSRGGSSLTAKNIRLLCARHNLSKGARIE